GRRALFRDNVPRRPVLTDRLPLPLPQPQQLDHSRAEQENEEKRGDHRPTRSEGQKPENVQGTENVTELFKKIKHSIRALGSQAVLAAPNRSRIRETRLPSRILLEPLIITASP